MPITIEMGEGRLSMSNSKDDEAFTKPEKSNHIITLSPALTVLLKILFHPLVCLLVLVGVTMLINYLTGNGTISFIVGVIVSFGYKCIDLHIAQKLYDSRQEFRK